MALDKYKVLTPLNRRFLATKKQRYTAMTLAVVLSVAVGQIIFNSFASNTALSSIPEVAKMQELTIKVTAMADEYAKMPDTIAGKKSTQQPNAAKAQKKQDLIALVNQRKDAYKVAMMYDPQVTADNYLPYDTRDKLPTDIQPSLEQINVISGTWMSAIVSQEPKAGDTTQTKQESHTISIVDANNNSISVYGNNLPNIDSGTPITVLGISVENSMTMALPSAIDQPAPTSSSVTFLQKINDIQPVHAATSIASRVCKSPSIRDFVKKYYLGGIFDDSSEDVCVTRLSNVREKVFCSDQKECTSAWDTPIDLTGDAGKRKTLVVPIQFASDTDLPITRDGLAGVYQRVTDSYNRMSYGKFAPHYDVWGNWQLTAASNSFPTCDDKNLSERQTAFSTIARNTVSANSELDNAIKTGGYTDVMYVLSDMICGGQSVGLWGWANVGYNRGDNYVAESFMSLGNDRNDVQTRFPAVMIHELGHTYGLNHARGACSEGAPSDPTQIDQSLFCLPADAEYANHYDPMGDVSDPDPTDFSFADKLRFNWVSKDDYYNVTGSSGQYTINAIDKSSGKRSLKLSYQGRDLYIDYRANDVSGAKGTSSRGLLVYYANSDHSTSLLGSNRSRISTTSPWTWNYFTAGQMGPFRIGVGDDAICVTPSSESDESIDVRVDRGCKTTTDAGTFSPSAFIGSEDSKFKQVWSYETNDKNTLLLSATSTCYDNANKLLFAMSSGQVLVYKMKSNGLPEDNRADYALGSQKVGEVVDQSAGWGGAKHYLPARYTSGISAITGSFNKLTCDTVKHRLFVASGNGFAPNDFIKVFDYSSGLKDGMAPIASFGHDVATGPSSATAVSDMQYSERYNTLILADNNNRRIIGFDLSSGLSNNTTASWVLGQPNLSATTKGSISVFETAVDDIHGKLFISGAFYTGVKDNYNSRIRQYDINDLKNNKQNYQTEIVPPSGNNPRYIVYDHAYNRLIAQVGMGDALQNMNINTYLFDQESGLISNTPDQTAHWTGSDDNGISTRDFGWSFNSPGQVIYRSLVNSNGSFIANHYDIFKVPIMFGGGSDYKVLRN